MFSPDDTIAALATPVGEGGLGVIRISGPESLRIINQLFVPAQPMNWAAAESHRCYFGRISADRPMDQVVVTLFRGPHSYTGDDVIEISAHGSPFVLQEILQLCLRAGARLAEPGEFTQRAFLHGKMDLTQAEAVGEFIRARGERAHAAALSQMEGALARKVRSLRDSLLPLLAHVEVGLDHSDEHHDFLNREELEKRVGAVSKQLDEILASARVGKVLRDGLRVTFVGRPNVGKSSLLNALLREDRAIVTPEAGTTRDTLEERVQWDGLSVVLTDTAGLRAAPPNSVEALGIERTRRALTESDLLVGLFDGSTPLTDEDQAVVDSCAGQPHLWAINKSDLPVQWESARLAHMNGSAPVVKLSARTGEGLQNLVHLITSTALQERATVGQAKWLLNARHQEALRRTQAALMQALEAARQNEYEECVALELQTALKAMGEIIGETPTEELLGQIFSQFCVGK